MLGVDRAFIAADTEIHGTGDTAFERTSISAAYDYIVGIALDDLDLHTEIDCWVGVMTKPAKPFLRHRLTFLFHLSGGVGWSVTAARIIAVTVSVVVIVKAPPA
jgi:hypothetical protein